MHIASQWVQYAAPRGVSGGHVAVPPLDAATRDDYVSSGTQCTSSALQRAWRRGWPVVRGVCRRQLHVAGQLVDDTCGPLAFAECKG
eukprot:COSAG02_NODE_7010_length_3228_cov_233.817194_3_plen_87_part_00